MGVDGVVIVGHGRSNAKAVKNAVARARQAVECKVLEALRNVAQTPSGGQNEA